jgi:hypothetical protein
MGAASSLPAPVSAAVVLMVGPAAAAAAGSSGAAAGAKRHNPDALMDLILQTARQQGIVAFFPRA